MNLRMVTIVGARPQFIKASAVSNALSKHDSIEEILIHTGQHFDANMYDIFFSQLGMSKPNYALDINRGSHGQMTGRMLEAIEVALLKERPDMVVVYGDTNSTLAGSLAASKLNIPVAHVEAGLRSFDRRMPEEQNRILTDHLSEILFCPTDKSVENLEKEGIRNCAKRKITKVGDVMLDASILHSSRKNKPTGVAEDHGFILCTFHRQENTDEEDRLSGIVAGVNALNKCYPVVIALHPRTKAALRTHGLKLDATILDPVGYFEMLWLLDHCGLVITDSGGVQKEAFFHSKHCVTMRDTTEWTELLDIDANVLVGTDSKRIFEEGRRRFGKVANNDGSLFGGGRASDGIANELAAYA